jgi:hypothetical protein
MAERSSRATPYTVSMILTLRRSAERDARRRLDAARAQLDRQRRREAQAEEQLRRAQQLLGRMAERPLPPRLPAQRLAEHQAALLGQRERVRRARAQHEEAAAEVHALLRHIEKVRDLLLLAIGRREAAELHEASERRERVRFRARRVERLEEEAVGRRRGVT